MSVLLQINRAMNAENVLTTDDNALHGACEIFKSSKIFENIDLRSRRYNYTNKLEEHCLTFPSFNIFDEVQ